MRGITGQYRPRLRRTLTRPAYGLLLLAYTYLLLSSYHGPSESGVVLVIEIIPLILFALQIWRHTAALWWLLALPTGCYGLPILS
jgi:hypothetical protein